jgi:hypothetical protein
MGREITLRQVSGSIGAALAKDMAHRLHIGAGDLVFAIETEPGIRLGLMSAVHLKQTTS